MNTICLRGVVKLKWWRSRRACVLIRERGQRSRMGREAFAIWDIYVRVIQYIPLCDFERTKVRDEAAAAGPFAAAPVRDS